MRAALTADQQGIGSGSDLDVPQHCHIGSTHVTLSDACRAGNLLTA
jgi:hypothetical protein